jgi:hypothetical protein
MNILVIGNGFDLAHNLPTQYTDFLRYCRDYNENNLISQSEDLCEEFSQFLGDNLWLSYFLEKTDLDDPKTWIDFEKEVSKIIKEFDVSNPIIELEHYINSQSEITLVFTTNDNFDEIAKFVSHFCECDKSLRKFIVKNDNIDSIDKLANYVHSQLRKFARAFEIYCLKVNATELNEPIITSELKKQIERAESNTKNYNYQAYQATGYTYRKDEVEKFKNQSEESSRLHSSLLSQVRRIHYLSMSKFDCVLSFNYTNTYERLYGNDKTKYCYIHGKAQKSGSATNVIFGIDDELSHGEESKNFTWVKFKKYYQRIVLKTGSEYKNWLTEQANKTSPMNYIHIVGHSLDRTDYDVLYELFNNSGFKILVYYYRPEDYDDKVQKVIQLLAYQGKNGRDELIRRVHGDNWSIKFVDQYDETEGLFLKTKKR